MEQFDRIDLHIHSIVSDGTDTPEMVLSRVKEAGIGLFSLTDHDAVKGCAAIISQLREGDPRFIAGAELSCRDEEGKYHILAYGYDPDAPSIRKLIAQGHGFRMKKVEARLAFLREKYGFHFPKEELDRLFSLENPGKPHIGNLMVKLGYARSKEEAINQYINKLRLRSEYLRPDTAIAAILDGGGIPVLAHPSYGTGEQLILGDDMEARIRRLMGFGLQGLEGFYSGFSAKLSGEILTFASRFGLYVTAGSDYHGSNKMIELGDTGLDDGVSRPDGLLRFLEDVRYAN